MAILLKEENVMSIIGTDKIKNGTNIVSSGDFITPVIERVASKNPANKAPESPINIFAGWKLYVKNASIAPAKINAINALIAFVGVIATAINPRVTDDIVTIDPASPSTPSIKFKAFEIPTIHKIVTI